VEEALVTRVLTVDLFRGVTAEWVHAHGGDLRWLAVARGQVIVDQGDAATDAFAVVSGQLEVVYRDGQGAERLVSTLGSGDTFGEIALLNGGLRTSMVRAVEPTELVAVSGQGFRELLADHPGLAARVTTIAAMRLRHTSVVADALEHLGLSERAAVAEIEPLIEWLQLASGDVLFNEGEMGDSAYVVLQGRLRAVAGLGGDERIVGEIGRGEIVGEMAVLDHEPRNATVFALRDTHLARFPPAAIDLLLDRFPQVMLHVARTVLRRIRRPLPHRGTEKQLSITVVALANDGPARAFTGQLAAALGRFGRTEHVTS
jgi:CRP-like cAMP-binding protein